MNFNNYQKTAQKYLFQLLQENYHKNEEMINRMTFNLSSEKDVQDFCRIAADTWFAGYKKCADQYKDKLKDLGYTVEIK